MTKNVKNNKTFSRNPYLLSLTAFRQMLLNGLNGFQHRTSMKLLHKEAIREDERTASDGKGQPVTVKLRVTEEKTYLAFDVVEITGDFYSFQLARVLLTG